jgi:alpha-L-rhamnosidase
MRKYLDGWVPRWTGKDRDAYAHTLTSGLGDWLPPEGVPTINALVSTAFYARMAHIAAESARVLKDGPGRAKYDALFGAIRSDFNARFLSKDGVYREKPDEAFVHTAQILPLAFGLVPDGQRAALAAKLADDITTKRGGHAYVGVIGAAYVLPVLTATRHHDVAFTVATKTDEPSWGFWTDALRFTALGESWPADTRSRNHHFFGAIVQWIYEDLAGLRPLEPGFALTEFAPEIPVAGLDAISAVHESVRGTVKSAWMRQPGGISFTIVVPPNARGRVLLPADDLGAVTLERDGMMGPLTGVAGLRVAEPAGGRMRIDVASGEYHFFVATR